MPRRGRGGSRQGKPGTAYGQRSDLQAPKAEFTGQPYGEATRQRESQAAVPVAAPPSQAMAVAQSVPQPGPEPGMLDGLLDPTTRPDEPTTAGLAMGPGAGPEALSAPDPDAAALDQLRDLYRLTGSDAILRLLRAADGY